jgi:pyruvate kinase
LVSGDSFTLTTEEIVGDNTRASMSFQRLPQTVKKGDTLFLNDGLIQLDVVMVEGKNVRCKVLVGGELRSRKGLNIPDIDLGISAFTDRDHECLTFAMEQGVDAVGQSFVESAADIEAVRNAAAKLGHNPFIIAKLERSRAKEDLDAIFEAADGIMVARGDLGRPTRAESTDVANAILDGTDCVMLSEESAMGRYPVDAVAMLAKIAVEIEPHRPSYRVREILRELDRKREISVRDLLTVSVEERRDYGGACFAGRRPGTQPEW